VIDKDGDLAHPQFRVVVDFSHDQTTFFYQNPRAIVTEGANDWAYFMDSMNLTPVAARTQQTTREQVTFGRVINPTRSEPCASSAPRTVGTPY